MAYPTLNFFRSYRLAYSSVNRTNRVEKAANKHDTFIKQSIFIKRSTFIKRSVFIKQAVNFTLMISIALFSYTLSASPIKDLNKLGQGEMSYLFWTLYSAELYSTPTNSEQALSIKYYRSIDSKDLVKATQDQWQKLGYQQNSINRWIRSLNDIWPSVEPGNTLTIRVSQDDTSQFYFNHQPIGTINDTAFGDAFLSIWLSENTSEPKLRRQLLGLNQ